MQKNFLTEIALTNLKQLIGDRYAGESEPDTKASTNNLEQEDFCQNFLIERINYGYSEREPSSEILTTFVELNYLGHNELSYCKQIFEPFLKILIPLWEEEIIPSVLEE